MMPKLLAVLAEFESGLLSERVRSVVETRARSGNTHGSPPAFGYRREDGIQVPEPAEANIVRRIYAEYNDGHRRTRSPKG
jgi:DNA invertase Pin-like site-specific DNA recombinase